MQDECKSLRSIDRNKDTMRCYCHTYMVMGVKLKWKYVCSTEQSQSSLSGCWAFPSYCLWCCGSSLKKLHSPQQTVEDLQASSRSQVCLFLSIRYFTAETPVQSVVQVKTGSGSQCDLQLHQWKSTFRSLVLLTLITAEKWMKQSCADPVQFIINTCGY